MSGPTFAEEFPHLSAMGKAGIRYLAAIGAALVVMGLCAWIGASPFLAGWFSCLAFSEVKSVKIP